MNFVPHSWWHIFKWNMNWLIHLMYSHFNICWNINHATMQTKARWIWYVFVNIDGISITNLAPGYRQRSLFHTFFPMCHDDVLYKILINNIKYIYTLLIYLLHAQDQIYVCHRLIMSISSVHCGCVLRAAYQMP